MAYWVQRSFRVQFAIVILRACASNCGGCEKTAVVRVLCWRIGFTDVSLFEFIFVVFICQLEIPETCS